MTDSIFVGFSVGDFGDFVEVDGELECIVSENGMLLCFYLFSYIDFIPSISLKYH
jgi:hypothetical protein